MAKIIHCIILEHIDNGTAAFAKLRNILRWKVYVPPEIFNVADATLVIFLKNITKECKSNKTGSPFCNLTISYTCSFCNTFFNFFKLNNNINVSHSFFLNTEDVPRLLYLLFYSLYL